MKKIFTIGLLSISFLAFAQKKKNNFVNLPKAELYKMFSNSAVSREMYPEETEKEKRDRFNDYYCLIKTYKIDFSTDSNFITSKEVNKQIEKEKAKGSYPAEAYSNVENLNTLYMLQMRNYNRRLDFYNNNKKCLKKADYDW